MKKLKKKNASKNILSIHWGFSIGGVGKYALLIDDVCKYRPISIDSLCILNKSWQCDEKGLENLKAERIYIKSRMDFSWVLKVLKYIHNCSPDLVMTHGFNGHFVVLLSKLISRHKIPFVCSYHGLYHPSSRSRVLFEKFLNYFTEFYIKNIAKSVIVVSEFSKDYLLKKGIPLSKITVIHNGINLSPSGEDERDKLRSQWGIGKDNILIGIASRIDPEKGLFFLIEAFEKLMENHTKIQMAIVGTGKSEKDLQSQVKLAGLSDNILFTGFRSDVSACLEAFDIFVLPSLAENHSIGLLEAMRAGKAIVATDVGGNTESVRHKKEGLIVSPKDPVGLEKAIERYLDNSEFALQMGQNAKIRFNENFTVDTMVKKTAAWMMGCARIK